MKEFHASEPQSFDHAYKGWNECQRKAFLQELITVIRDTLPGPSKPLAALLQKGHFDNLPTARQKQWGSDAYYPCLQSVIASAGWHAKRLYRPSETVSIVCDEEDRKTKKIAEEVYLACKRTMPDELVSGFIFEESYKLAGLQLADFVAYYSLQHCRRVIRAEVSGDYERVIDKPWWPMEQLMGIFMPDFDIFNNPPLSRREPLTDYSALLS